MRGGIFFHFILSNQLNLLCGKKILEEFLKMSN